MPTDLSCAVLRLRIESLRGETDLASTQVVNSEVATAKATAWKALESLDGMVFSSDQRPSDELICCLKKASAACYAAVEVMRRLDRLNEGNVAGIIGRVAIDHGAVAIDGAVLGGEAVERTQQVLSVTPQRKIVMPMLFARLLPESDASMLRHFDAPEIGAGEWQKHGLKIYQWESEAQPEHDVTRMPTAGERTVAMELDEISLVVDGRLERFSRKQCPIEVGRDRGCDVTIENSLASRFHGRILHEQGKFFFEDKSTNGSYLLNESGNEMKVHGERVPLNASGVISPGAPVHKQKESVVKFLCQARTLNVQNSDAGATVKR